MYFKDEVLKLGDWARDAQIQVFTKLERVRGKVGRDEEEKFWQKVTIQVENKLLQIESLEEKAKSLAEKFGEELGPEECTKAEKMTSKERTKTKRRPKKERKLEQRQRQKACEQRK